MANSDSDSDDSSLSPQPFAFAILPLVAIFALCFTGVFFFRRRHRRLHPDSYQSGWHQSRVLTPGGHLAHPSGGRRNRNGRWTPWSGTRSEEGLNELGEAPPPYKHDHAMRDLEAGQSPPDYQTPPYVAEPEPTHSRGAGGSSAGAGVGTAAGSGSVAEQGPVTGQA